MKVQLRATGFSYDLFEIDTADVQPFADRCSPFINHNVSYTAKGEKRKANSLHFHRIDFNLLNFNPAYKIETSEPSKDYLNFYTTATPTEGVTQVRHYTSVTYKNIYSGIDLEFIVTQNQGYKYNFVVHPGGNINDIQLKITGPDQISQVGDTLKFSTSLGIVDELIPESYLLTDRSETTSSLLPSPFGEGLGEGLVKAHFRQISQGVFGFSVEGEIPENATLIIDPTCKRIWGTYYGGQQDDYVRRMIVDNDHSVLISGWTSSVANIATAGTFQSSIAQGRDCFMARLSPCGSRVWGT
jgi:hypothetical protein